MRVALVLAVVAGAALLVPAVVRERVVYSSTPAPPPLFEQTVVQLERGEQACTSGVVVGTDAELVRVNVRAIGGDRPVPLELRLEGDGYATRGTVSDYPAPGADVAVPIEPPERPTEATLCFDNVGPALLGIGATSEPRTRSRTTTELNGEPIDADPTIQLLRRERRSLAATLGTQIERAATFKPAGTWLFWVLAVLVVAGLPLGVAGALAVEARQRQPEAAELEQDEGAEHERGEGAPQAGGQDVRGHREADRHE